MAVTVVTPPSAGSTAEFGVVVVVVVGSLTVIDVTIMAIVITAIPGAGGGRRGRGVGQ